MDKKNKENNRIGLETAVIGMAGRFPGAKNLDEFWENLKNGVESITFFSDEELEEAGVDARLLENPHYVKANGILDDIDCFDASFFGYTPMEAEIMNPQLRIFHECAWQALEDVGYDPFTYEGLIGLYAGASSSLYWQGISILSGKSSDLGGFAAENLTDKDYLSTRVAYKLNLKGPANTVQTACSTSLIAIHQACRAVLSGECQIALAGGVTITLFQKKGYMYQEGLILSPDGHCRAFDAEANGTVGGDGVGIVVLKRLINALTDGDNIYAVIKSSAANNDGNRKVGFSAPSAEGQAEAIRTALRMARVEPESIGYIETHGTGTILGDPVEMEALTMAFETDRKQFCRIGSVKANVGHLDSAAGVTSFIKTVLILKHKQIPPSFHFKRPNPGIDFDNTPFFVNRERIEWRGGEYPLRAGVSSFGIGGTNAHVILEEAPEIRKDNPSPRKQQLILLSARTKSALQQATKNLVEFLENHPGINLPNVAYTLQIGRRDFPYRKMAVCSTVHEVIEVLSSPESEKVRTSLVKEGHKSVVFMFPGQGSQYINMGSGLYEGEPVFREKMDQCFEILRTILKDDLKNILYPTEKTSTTQVQDMESPINQTEVTQPLLFVFEYALAELLIQWEITPNAMIGHSIGEYVAACLAGVFSLKDALMLVALRGKLMQQMPEGSMLSVSLPEEDIIPLLNDEISIAAVNSPKRCTVSGTNAAIDRLEKQINQMGHKTRRLHTSHAFHSKMMEPILKTFEEKVGEITLNEPLKPFISNLTGKWIEPQEATSPSYWAKHLKCPVRFTDGLTDLLKEESSALLEVGPGRVLSTFVRHHPGKKSEHLVTNLVKHPQENESDVDFLLNKIGWLWSYGIKIDWAGFYSHEKRCRVSLPTYPFERQRFPFKPPDLNAGILLSSPKGPTLKRADMGDWFYIPAWERVDRVEERHRGIPDNSHWLIFINDMDIGYKILTHLGQERKEVIRVRQGTEFKRINNDEFSINPQRAGDYKRLLTELKKSNGIPRKILHLWNVTKDEKKEIDIESIGSVQDDGYYSLLYLAQAIGELDITEEIQVGMVTNNMMEVTGLEVLSPGKATVLGAVKVIPLEYPNIKCRCIDIVLPEIGGWYEQRLIHLIIDEMMVKSPDAVVAVRGIHRWVQAFKPVYIKKSPELPGRLRQEGVYLITGGFGGMGFTFAEHLAKTLKARLILVGRSPFPAREHWEQWLLTHEKNDSISQKIRKIEAFETVGAEVLVFSADVADQEQMHRVIHSAQQRFGPINGVFHTAGVPDYHGVIQRRTREMSEAVMAPKVYGTVLIDSLLKNVTLDFFLLFSSAGTVFYPSKYGQVAYCAANDFLDQFAYYKTYIDGTFTIAINWEDWYEVGMTVKALNRKFSDKIENFDYSSKLENAITPGQGMDAFQRILGENFPRVVISTQDLGVIMEQYREMGGEGSTESTEEEESIPEAMYERGDLSTEYVGPEDKIEENLVKVWQKFFSIQEVGILDDFFELGGDSLQAMTMVSLIHKELDVKIPIPTFFSGPSIGKIAEYMRKTGEKSCTSIELAEQKEYYLLASAQKRIYIVEQMEEGGVSYNQPMIRILEGKIDKNRLEKAFINLIKRHEGLRTSFTMRDNEIVQKVHRDVYFNLKYFEIKREPVELVIKNFIKPFVLSDVPLIRAALVKETEERHILMIDIHHIVSDGISNNILVKQLMELYEEKQLPDVKIQYKDFSEWQNRLFESGVIKKQEKYWLDRFSDDIPELKIAMDFPRPGALSFEKGDFVEKVLEKEWTQKVNDLARETGTTVFMVLLAVYYVLLSRYTGQEDIVVGSPVSGRSHPDLEEVTGVFLNMLAIRTQPKVDKTFKEFLEEVKENSLSAFENQDFPFDDLVARLGLQGSANRNPLFDVEFALQKGTSSEVEFDGLKLTSYKKEIKFAKFDLHLQAIEESESIILRLRYSIELFTRPTIENMLQRYIEILEQAVKKGDNKLEDIIVSHQVLIGKPTVDLEDTGGFEFETI